MAVAYQSSSTANTVTATSVTITKPTGLSVGDLMIAQINLGAGTTTLDINTLSGWTLLGTGTNNNFKMSIQYKIADAGDVAASNFTFSGSASSPVMSGGITRISGQGGTPIDVYSSFGLWSGSSANLALGITPTRANDLLLIFVGMLGTGGNGDTDISTYAIATSNPSWTEAYEIGPGTYDGAQAAVAYAIRPETTNTGNVSFNSSKTGTSGGLAIIVAVKNNLDVTVTPNPVTSATTIADETVTGGATVAANPITTALTIGDADADQAMWSNQSKNTTSWTNQSKN